MKAAFSCIVLALVCASSTEGFSGRLHHHIYCWSVNAVATNQCSGAWTTVSNPGPPTAPPASVTATVRLGIPAAHVREGFKKKKSVTNVTGGD